MIASITLVTAVNALLELIGLPGFEQRAAQAEARKRCAGRLQELTGSNMWS